MTEEFSYEIKIPKERVAVLIGTEGEVKKDLEKDTNTRLVIDSKEGDVFVYGTDALGLYTTREIIKAIGRGFNPEIAKLLLKHDYVFELIDITEFTGKSKNSLLRLKGRVIGKEGKSRKQVEDLSEASITVYGKTVGIIGQVDAVAMAKKAVENLLKGSTHANVYKWLEKKRREMKRQKMTDLI